MLGGVPWSCYMLDDLPADVAHHRLAQNFPVDKVSSSYHTLWNSFKRVAAAAGLSDSDKRHVFAETAKRVYSLNLPSRL